MKVKKRSANNAPYVIIGDYRLPESESYARLSEIRRSIRGSVFYRVAELIRDSVVDSSKCTYPYGLNKMTLNRLIGKAEAVIKLQSPRHRPAEELRIQELCFLLLELIPKIQSKTQLADWKIMSHLHNGLPFESESLFNDELKTQLIKVAELITLMRSGKSYYLYTRYMKLIGTPINMYEKLTSQLDPKNAQRRLNEFRKNLHEQAISVEELESIRKEAINSIPENFAYIGLLFQGLKKSELP